MDGSVGLADIVLVIANKTDWTTVFVGLITGVFGVLGTHWLWARQVLNERKSVKAALVSEVSALLEVIRKRRYLSALQNSRDRAIAGEIVEGLEALVPDHYNRVYQQNVTRLGCLPPKDAAQIVRFHQLLDSVRIDISPGGIFTEDAPPLEAWIEGAAMLEEVVEIGESLVMSNQGSLLQKFRSINNGGKRTSHSQ